MLDEMYGSSDYGYIGKISGTRKLYSVLDNYFIIKSYAEDNKHKIETVETYCEKNPNFCLRSTLKSFSEDNLFKGELCS